MSASFQYDVFLSHKGAQKDWTETLARRLRDDGFNVWFDKWELNRNPGRNWIAQLRDGVQASHKVLLVLSPEFFAGAWTTFESSIIQLIDPVGREDRVIPLLHTPCEIPADWSFRQALDFTSAPLGTVEFEFRYHQLAHALDNRRPYEGDFERFKVSETAKNLDLIPTVQNLPRGSRMPHASNPLFVGREDEMRALAKMLTPGAGSAVGVHAAVAGMGGVGKTQLAIEYAYRYGSLYRGGVFWLSFAQEKEIITEVAACGGHEAEAIPDWSAMKPAEKAQKVQEFWQESDLARLLIFDNAEEPAMVEQWRPKRGRCSVLITCRRDEWPAKMGVKPLPIETLPREKSIELLAEARPSINTNAANRGAADNICQLLGDLPLALTVAAAYLSRYKHDGLAEYLQALSSRPVIQDSSLKKEISASFALSFDRLNPKNAKDTLAQKLFYLASWFAPASINRALLAASAGLKYVEKKDDRHRADDALTRLQELGLIKPEPDGRLVLHRLLREFARQNTPQDMGGQEAINAVGENLKDFANKEWKSGLPQALALERVHLRYLATEAERPNPRLAASLYNLLGLNGSDLALFHEAKADYENAIRLSEAVHGTDHPDVATCINNLAAVFKDLGDLAEARTNYERALKIDEVAYGQDHPDVAIDANNLGTVLQELGDLEGARANFERALKIGETTYGRDHPQVAVYTSNLGRVLMDLGDPAGARAIFERSLRIGENVFGPNHPTVAIRLNNLGAVLQDLGDLEGSRANFERALDWGNGLRAGSSSSSNIC